MVMERAAKMAATATGDSGDEALIKTGMRLGAAFLNQTNADLIEEIGHHPATEQGAIIRGVGKTLLRNIVLPRDEHLQQVGRLAITGLVSLAPSNAEIRTICQELEQILQQYSQHKEQTTQQLEDAIRGQLEQQQMAEGRQAQAEINPAMHPQYKEELSKVLTNLNNQYNEALDQRKQMISQCLASSL